MGVISNAPLTGSAQAFVHIHCGGRVAAGRPMAVDVWRKRVAMRYRIASDIPGRLSLRCGRYAFDDAEARGIAVMLMSIEGVSHAEAHELDGCILVECRDDVRKIVFEAINALDPFDLPALPEDSIAVPHELGVALENNRFALRAVGMVLRRIVNRLLLPAPVRMAMTLFRSLRFIFKGLRSLARGRLTVEVLDAAVIAMSIARGSFKDASSIMFLVNFTGELERHVQRRVRIAMAESLITRAETVWAVVDGEDVAMPMGEVAEGQVLHLGTGQVLPVDGVVVEGAGELNEASMTGEPQLVHKKAGSAVFAGTALENGDLYVRVTAPPGRSRIDSIAAMVGESASFKADIQSNAEHLADSLVPVSFLAFAGVLAFTRSLSTAMAVLVVDYSCAVRLSTPICVTTAMGEASKHNIIVKGGKYLEAVANADTVVFDKTGTLTAAAPQVTRVISFGDMEEDEILRYAACIEEHFPHSVARAVVRESRDRGLDHTRELHAKVDYVVAHGIKTEILGHSACIGSQHFVFDDEKVAKPRGMAQRIRKEAGGASVVYFALDGRLEGVICIEDPVRPEAKQVLSELRALGVERFVMLTGDSAQNARNVARRLGIDEYHAQVLPEDKSNYVMQLREEGHTVAMIGDGINDSPALAAADVSIALSDASDIARAVADISMLEAHLDDLVVIRRLSQLLMARIKGDYRLIVALNTSFIVLGVAGVLSLTTASALHNLTTLGIAAANTRSYLPKLR